MMPVVAILGVIVFIPMLAIALLLRRLFQAGNTFADLADRFDLSADLSATGRTLSRLLDPQEFRFLRSRSLSPGRIRQLRGQRRAIFRRYLRAIAADFNRLHQALRFSLVQSQTDRPDLARELARQRWMFYCNLTLAELRLTVNACGMERVSMDHLVRQIETIHARLLELAPDSRLTMAAASA